MGFSVSDVPQPLRPLIAGLLAVVAVLGMSVGAVADERPVPTQSEVDAATAKAERRAGDVAAIQAELVVARTRLENAASRAEVAAEAYNGARWRLQQATEKATAAAKAAREASDQVEAQRAGIAALATQSFTNGSELAGVTAFLSPEGPSEIADRITVTQSVAATLEEQFEQFAAADTLAEDARRTAEAAQRDQESQAVKAEQARDDAATAANAAQDAAQDIAGQRQTLIAELATAQKISVALATRRQNGLEKIAQEKAAQAAAQAAAAEEAAAQAAAEEAAQEADDQGGNSGNGGGSTPPPSPPADPPPATSTGAAARAIAFARQQLGEPYRWAAAGPDAWDCSGLTMRAWQAGGVSLPHYSAAQYDATTPISVGQLRPGDLVFWGDSPSSIHHVALYIGNGQILHAPRTGRPVAIDSMYYWVPPRYFGRP